MPTSANILTFCLPTYLRHFVEFSFANSKGILYLSTLVIFSQIFVSASYAAVEQSSRIKADDNSGLSLSAVVEELPASWGLKAAPDNTLYVTHRAGSLSRYSLAGERVSHYELALDDLHLAGQGGLSAIAFHPQYEKRPWIYLSYSYGTNDANGLKVIRLLMSDASAFDASIVEKQVIFEQQDLRDTSAHYGARLAFMADNTLLITTGDGFDYRESAQKLDSQLGKVLRVTETGEIPADNPFVDAENKSQSFVYSYGHRNPQGLIVLPNGQVISHEHGPDGGDEVNFINPGNNYGWPVITLGKDYIGSQITPFTEYPNMQQPAYNWTPSIAPSGMIFYAEPGLLPLVNRLLLTSLKYQQLHALALNGNKVENEEIYFEKSGYRMRDITLSSDGRLFILSDGAKASILEVVMTQ